MMSRDEHKAIIEALARWFDSQEISPEDAAFVMAMMVGSITAEIMGHKHTAQAMIVLKRVMDKGAEIIWKHAD